MAIVAAAGTDCMEHCHAAGAQGSVEGAHGAIELEVDPTNGDQD